MKRFNSVFVVPVRSLEVGDLIAKEFLGSVVAGEILGIAYAAYQLTDDQKTYMKAHSLHIPENEYEALGGADSCLLFGNFSGVHMTKDQPNHMYLSFDQNVAVFPTKRD